MHIDDITEAALAMMRMVGPHLSFQKENEQIPRFYEDHFWWGKMGKRRRGGDGMGFEESSR